MNWNDLIKKKIRDTKKIIVTDSPKVVITKKKKHEVF